jgi:hypothetical protein
VPKEGLEPRPEGYDAASSQVNAPEAPTMPSDNLATTGERSDSGAIGEPLADAVENALASALGEATKAGKWDVVAQLARELEARREARSASNIVDLARARRRV